MQNFVSLKACTIYLYVRKTKALISCAVTGLFSEMQKAGFHMTLLSYFRCVHKRSQSCLFAGSVVRGPCAMTSVPLPQVRFYTYVTIGHSHHYYLYQSILNLIVASPKSQTYSVGIF